MKKMIGLTVFASIFIIAGLFLALTPQEVTGKPAGDNCCVDFGYHSNGCGYAKCEDGINVGKSDCSGFTQSECESVCSTHCGSMVN